MIREELITALELAAPALLVNGEAVVSAFGGFCFTKRSITAYNDVIAVRVLKPDGDFQGVIPGRLLLKFLKSCTGKHVSFEKMSKDDMWCVKCGPTRLDLSYQDTKVFPFQFPKSDPILVLDLDEDFFYGLGLCASIVSDTGLASWTGGVTFRFDNILTLVSTSPTRSQVYCYTVAQELNSKKTRTKILPVSFCKVAFSLHKKFSEEKIRMEVQDNYVVLRFGEAVSIVGRTIIPDINIDIVEKVQDFLEELGNFVPISDKLREVVERSASIARSDIDVCSLNITDDGQVHMKTQVVGGVVEDSLSLEILHPEIDIRANPKRLAGNLSECTEFKIIDRLTGFRGGQFIKLIANRGA